ncbi:MAG TPA: DUF1579 family protein [Verrucomicrobiota bacterium]|nr:DUF1579 family protein [Verrucomicrobiota bacterium]
MKSTVAILSLIVSLLAPQLRAGDPPKKPGPEHKKLEVLTGKWKWEENLERTPWGPPRKAIGRSEVRFIHRGFAVHEYAKGRTVDPAKSGDPGSPGEWTILTYCDPDQRTYRALWLDSEGQVDNTVGSVEGTTWSWAWKHSINGKVYDFKETDVFAPGGRSRTCEVMYSDDDATWKPYSKCVYRKVGKAK